MTAEPLIREVTAPGAVFWEKVTHPENQELLEGDPTKTRKLSKDRLKLAIRKFEQLQDALNLWYSAYLVHLSEQHAIYSAAYSIIVQTRLWHLLQIVGIAAARRLLLIEDHVPEIAGRIATVKHYRRNPYRIRNHRQAAAAQTLLHRIAARLDEHYRAIENAIILKRLRDEMMGEINFYANEIVDTWTRLGYREEVTIKGRTRIRRVKMEEAHYTEDSIQFKVWVTSLTILQATRPELPDRVRAWDLVKGETLRELEAACECPVSSPHIPDEEDQDFSHGAWVEVHRVGMRGGLFEYIELSTVLAKYNQALRPRYAIPIGIKAGRQIEYVYLDSTPHMIVTGITGSGKTNLERVILTSLIKFYDPTEIRFVLVDLKRGGDLNDFQAIPHLLTPIVKDIRTLGLVAGQIYAEMLRRAAVLSAADAFDIIEYNRKVDAESRLPRIVFMIDECGTIKDAAESKDQRDSIWRYLGQLAMLARSAGIHLILCSQQPGVQVIPAPVTNNITVSIDGRQRTSSGAMQTSGDNRLKGLPAIPGRMLYDNGMAYFQIQTPFAVKAYMGEVVQIAKDYPPAPPLLLPGDDDHETQPVPIMAGVTREKVIDLALELNGGILSAPKLFDATGKSTPIRTISGLIADIAESKYITHNEIVYEVVRWGRGYKLSKRINESTDTHISNSVDSHVDSPVYTKG